MGGGCSTSAEQPYVADATEAAAAPFVEALGVRTPLGAAPVADLSRRHKPRGAPLWRLPWVFDLAALRRTFAK